MNNVSIFSSLMSQGGSPPPLSTKYLLIAPSTSYFYNPATDGFDTGPVPPFTSTIDYFYISSGVNSGKYLILTTTTSTYLYDPIAETFSTGPSLAAAPAGSTRNFLIPSGTYANYTCVIRGRDSSTTELYEPSTGTFIAGPSFPDLVGGAVRTFPINSGPQAGNILIVRARNTTGSYIYECATSSFITGPAASISSGNQARAGLNFALTTGGHRLISAGAAFNGNSSIYDEATNTFSAGPTFNSSIFIGLGQCSFTANLGAQAGNEIIFTTENSNLPGFIIFNRATNLFSAKTASTNGGTDSTASATRFGFFVDSGTYQDQFMYFSQNSRFVFSQTGVTMTNISNSPATMLLGIKY